MRSYRAVLVLVCAASLEAADSEAAFFTTRILPLLAHNCFACHTDSRLGGLRLDSREAVLQGGKSGPAILLSNPEDSLLIQAVSYTHSRLKMPPTGKLKEEEIADLRSWIKSGAVWPETSVPKAAPLYVITPERRAFWAFQPVRKPPLPTVKNEDWVRSPIDRFILAKLEESGLKPVGPASKQALIRRATFDLIGLPPSPEEVDAFVNDNRPDAFAKVVDRLLSSPHYGERWGRYWLDLARYADGQLGASKDTPYENAFRYRDWVIQALNEDMPYDVFVKAQIAADRLDGGNREKLLPGLGFLALGDSADERVDVTTRTFLALTVGCARCHDHKFDPIPTKDYYSLAGIFQSSQTDEIPLAPNDAVEAWKKHKKKIDDLQEAIDDFIKKQSADLSEMLAAKTARYMMAVFQAAPADANLNPEILSRWKTYLKDQDKEHPFLKSWFALVSSNPTLADVKKAAEEFQSLVIRLFAEKREIDDRNYVKLGGAKGAKDERTRQYTNLESLEIEKYYLWRDLASDPFMRNGVLFPGGIYYYGVPSTLERDFKTRGGEVRATDIDGWLGPEWKEHLDRMRAELSELKRTLPTQYPFLHAFRDSTKPANARVAIRGDQNNLGEEAPRRFLQILSEGEPKPFTAGSGRLELATAISSSANPLTARVLVNRVWHLHFGKGIVRSPGNFGQMGERPTHPELLDYLAARFMENGWSLKKLHREIMLSSVYMLSADHSAENYTKDPDNRLLWRANLRHRLDVEAMRDALLAVAGTLDLTVGGPPERLDEKNHRRTIYAYIGRTQPDAMLTLFDFPNPNNTSEQRTVTAGPLQRLFFMNSEFVRIQAQALAGRLKGTDAEKIDAAYRLLFARRPTDSEVAAGLDFLKNGGDAWAQYAQVLLSSSEFSALN